MQKHKFAFLCKISIISLILLASCKTLPQQVKLKPLDLLDGSSAIYFSIPSSVDSEFLSHIVRQNIKNISKENADKIVSRTDIVYCGITQKKHSADFQLAAKVDIPLFFANSYFTSKNGWQKLDLKKSSNTYSFFQRDDLQICLPSSELLLGGMTVPSMLNKYDAFVNNPDSILLNPDIKDEFYNFLTETKSEIRFFSENPASFLAIVFGTEMDLKIRSVKGSFCVNKKNPNIYDLTLILDFKSETFLKAGRSLLSFALGLIGTDNIVSEGTCLELSGLHLNRQQMYKFFVL